MSSQDAKSSFTILLVEDEETLRDLLSDVLRYDGYRVLTAESAEEALRMLGSAAVRSEQIDLLLTDLLLPRMDGEKLAQQFGERAAIPTLFITGSPEVIERLGSHRCLEKPFTSSSLLEQVARSLGVRP